MGIHNYRDCVLFIFFSLDRHFEEAKKKLREITLRFAATVLVNNVASHWIIVAWVCASFERQCSCSFHIFYAYKQICSPQAQRPMCAAEWDAWKICVLQIRHDLSTIGQYRENLTFVCILWYNDTIFKCTRKKHTNNEKKLFFHHFRVCVCRRCYRPLVRVISWPLFT